jgi:hypothetical protein
MLMLTAKVWGQRPSAYLGRIEPLVALLLDDALAARLLQESRRQPTSQPDPDVVAAGSRYEGPADWGVPLFDDARAAESRAAYRELIRGDGTMVH